VKPLKALFITDVPIDASGSLRGDHLPYFFAVSLNSGNLEARG